MTKTLRKAGILLTLVAAIAACAHQATVENIYDAPVPTGPHKLTGKEISSVIAKAAIDRGWTVQQTKPGTLHLKIVRHDNTYQAETDVTYTPAKYSIVLVSSQNLDQSGDQISSAYNRYIDYLKADIDKGLSAAVFQ